MGKAANHLPELAGIRVERKLSAGPLSDKWLIASDAGQWVLRKDKPLVARLNLDRYAELRVLDTLAASGWCSEALWGDVQQGVLIVPYVPGRVWTAEDVQQSGQLERLAVLLSRLHSSAAQLPPFGLIERVHNYARFIGTSAAEQSAQDIGHMLMEATDSGRIAVCHNDPVAGNVVDHGQLHLIDFEFAAAGDPLFDLAAVIEHHRLPPGGVQLLVDAYRQAGGACDMRRLEQWRMIYGQTVSLWHQVVAA